MADAVHPAWNDLLAALPEALHPAVIPHLQKFSTNADSAIQQVKESYKAYEEYKPLVENKIPLSRVGDALGLAHELESNPSEMIKNIVEHWGLDFVPKGTETPNPDDDDDLYGDGTKVDITKDPAFIALSKQYEQLAGQLTSKQQADLEAQELAEFEKEITATLSKEENKHIPKDLLVAYMSQDWEAEDAIAEINKHLGKTVTPPEFEKDKPPVIMGGETAGSGLPDGSINFGTMKKSAVDDTVIKALEAMRNNSNQG